MKYFLLLFIFFIQLSVAQKHQFKIKEIVEINPTNKNQTYKFPLLVGEKELSKKVNRDLIQSLLELNITEKHKSIFENIWTTKEKSIPNLSFLDYQINQLNDNVYSVTFHTEGCGAYCEEFDISYNYNIKTGKRIQLESLFSEEGKTIILEKLNKQKIGLIKETISKLELEKEKTNIRADIVDYTKRIQLLKDCKDKSEIDNLNYFDFKITENQIIIYTERCSNHAMRALDEIGEFEYFFKTKDIKKLLSNFGKNVITHK